MIITLLATIALPLAFLGVARGLRLYAAGGYAPVALSCGWGIVAWGLAYAVNGLAQGVFAGAAWAAPAAEATALLAVAVLVLRPGFTYFVDGAVYGLAAGIGLAAADNLAALARPAAGAGVIAAWGPAVATLGAYGSAGAWAGAAFGWAKTGRGASRGLSLLAGSGAAIALTRLASAIQAPWPWMGALALSTLGLGTCALFIRWGWEQERRRWHERACAGPASLDTLLAPVTACFGEGKSSQLAAFVRQRARVALRGRLRGLTADAGLASAFDAQMIPLRQQLRALRRAVGIYCLAYAWAVLPPETDPAWSRLAWEDGAAGAIPV